MIRTLRAAFTIVILAAVSSGCGPRGESKTLDEIYVTARDGYMRMSKADLAQDVSQSLEKISSGLDGLVTEASGQSANAKAQQVLDQLASIVNKSGYTVRPAMTELIHQYQEVAANPSINDSSASVKLLAAKTYRLLSSELETSKFRIQ